MKVVDLFQYRWDMKVKAIARALAGLTEEQQKTVIENALAGAKWKDEHPDDIDRPPDA